MKACWEELPSKRPTFTALRDIIDHMMQELSPSQYLTFEVDESREYYMSPSEGTSTECEVFEFPSASSLLPSVLRCDGGNLAMELSESTADPADIDQSDGNLKVTVRSHPKRGSSVRCFRPSTCSSDFLIESEESTEGIHSAGIPASGETEL